MIHFTFCRLDERGRIVLPVNFRDKLGLGNGSLVKLKMTNNEVKISNIRQDEVNGLRKTSKNGFERV